MWNNQSNVAFHSCYKCKPEDGRSSGCHTYCKKYIAEKEAYDKEQNKIKAVKSRMYIMDDYKASKGVCRMV